MKGVMRIDQPQSFKRKRTCGIDFKLCLLCQRELKEGLVKKSSAKQKLFDAVRVRNECEDSDYNHLEEHFKNITDDEMTQFHARWHLSCYKKCTHKGNIDRLQTKYKKNKRAENEEASASLVCNMDLPCTRSQNTGTQLQKDACFFCDGPEARRHPLYTVSTEETGKKIYDAVQRNENNQWKLKLSGCINPKDAYVYGMAYHKACYAKNVINILRSTDKTGTTLNVPECASRVEFIDCLLEALLAGNVIAMEDAERQYKEICNSNSVKLEDMLSRKSLKTLIENELFYVDAVFTNPISKNQSQRISLKSVNDVVLSQAEASSNINTNMKILYQAAKILRKTILTEEKWKFTGSITQNQVSNAIPKEILSFFKWCIGGRERLDSLLIGNKHLEQKAAALSQTLMYECLTERQALHGAVASVKPRHTRDLPLQVAVGLTIHSKTRSKFLVQLMHGLGSSIDYNKVLRLETAMANEILRRMEDNGGIYVPPNLVKGRFVYFAADNLDFLEDTPDGRGTLHATVMTCYQESLDHDGFQSITLHDADIADRSLQELPIYMTDFIPYNGPKLLKPRSIVFKESNISNQRQNLKSLNVVELAWCLCKNESIKNSTILNSENTKPPRRQDGDEIATGRQNQRTSCNQEKYSYSACIPTWTVFNAKLQKNPKHITRICVLPIIPATPTDRSTQLTFLTYLENLAKHICGADSKCIVTLDLGLYRPVQQLMMAQHSLRDRFVLRPGELHICMALLRAIGTFIDGSGIPEMWEVWYSESTVQQIIMGKHVRRAEEAHKRTLVALYDCYMEVFLKKYPCANILKKVQELQTKSIEGNDIKDLLDIIQKCNISDKMKEFDGVHEQSNPTFKMMREYMIMVECLLRLMRSVRCGDWNEHISSVKSIIGYFFVLDLHNYSGMMAYYLEEMSVLKEACPTIWSEFEKGNWVVRKTTTPFCALGADEALEQQNRSLKVTGGLVGITQHPRALARYFLTAPDLHHISDQTSNMAGILGQTASHKHSDDSKEAILREDIVINELRAEFQRVGNPFLHEGPELINIATKAVFSECIKKDVIQIRIFGNRLYEEFRKQRLVSETKTINLWDPIKRNKLNLCSSAKRKIKIKEAGIVKDLKADRSLFARLLVVSRSQRDIDLRNTLGVYEFSAVPRALFNYDGTMHLCSQKSKLIDILKSIPLATTPSRDLIQNQMTSKAACTNSPKDKTFSVAIVDGMAELRALEKSNDIKTCKDMAEAFTKKLQMKYWEYNEVHIVFDTYQEHSIKNMTRQKRLHDTGPTRYQITDATKIVNVTMKKLLSHISTKDELTAYLAQKVLHHAQVTKKDVVVSWRAKVSSSHCSLDHLQSTQEEADTKIILHAIDATERGATKLHIFSQDTDVLILSIRRYPKLPTESYFVPTSKDMISLADLFTSLGPLKASALPAFHALSGSDSTGTLLGKGKLSYWKVFSAATEHTLLALSSIGTQDNIPVHVLAELEAFICQVYQPRTNITKLEELRWSTFCKRQTSWEKLPPTRSAFIPAMKRVNYQVMIWNQDCNPQPIIPSPIGHGWNMEDGKLVPVLCEMPCAPDSILTLIRCSCMKNRCSPPCKCFASSLPCTDMCECGGSNELCDNDKYTVPDEANSRSDDDMNDDSDDLV